MERGGGRGEEDGGWKVQNCNRLKSYTCIIYYCTIISYFSIKKEGIVLSAASGELLSFLSSTLSDGNRVPSSTFIVTQGCLALPISLSLLFLYLDHIYRNSTLCNVTAGVCIGEAREEGGAGGGIGNFIHMMPTFFSALYVSTEDHTRWNNRNPRIVLRPFQQIEHRTKLIVSIPTTKTSNSILRSSTVR